MIEGRIGIFWLYQDASGIFIFGVRDNVQNGDVQHSMRDCSVTHIESWNKVRFNHRDRYPELAYIEDYEELPRGRVVFHKKGYFIIYLGNEQYHDEAVRKEIIDYFDLTNSRVSFIVDEHYSSYEDT